MAGIPIPVWQRDYPESIGVVQGRGKMIEIANISNSLSVGAYLVRPSSSGLHGGVGAGSGEIHGAASGLHFRRAVADAMDQSSFRVAKLQAIRSEIDQGTYENPERINATVDRLIDIVI